MPSTDKKRIVIPVDGSQNSLNALKHLTSTFNARTGMKFVLLHIIPSLPPISSKRWNRAGMPGAN